MRTDENIELLQTIDARTRLAGSNQMEILLFSLGSSELFGVNVFKVREVAPIPKITKTPNMPPGVVGVISLRGKIVPVISMPAMFGLDDEMPCASDGMLVMMEYSRHLLGFLVKSVDRIVRVDWDQVRPPESVLARADDRVIALTKLDGDQMVSIVDVEQILSDVFGEAEVGRVESAGVDKAATVFFVDDSAVARKKIAEVLDKMGVQHRYATNGQEGWDRLLVEADMADVQGRSLQEKIRAILVDAEMPVMDGYVLTRKIKEDGRFSGVPVIMHSSLSSSANRSMGERVGVDGYVGKFDAAVLAETLRSVLSAPATSRNQTPVATGH
jgi:two-component system, chemotaxis family, chemotaxis protein CheV